jgi:hypothetical protein
MRFAFFKICLLFLFPLLGKAQINQNKNLLDQKVYYSKYIVQDFFSEKKNWFWFVDVVQRRQADLGQNNIFANPLRYSIRPYIGYQFNPYWSVMVNPIGYFRSEDRLGKIEDTFNPIGEDELRTTAEILNYSYIYKRGKQWINITHRYRFESRWRDVFDERGRGTQWNYRFRYRIRLRTPLNNKHFYDNNVMYLCNYHEFHLENGSNYGTNHLSQNRNFVGLGYRFWNFVRVDVGYLHQYNWRGNGTDIDMSRGPMFYLIFDYLSKTNWGGKHRPTPKVNMAD